MCGGLCGCGNGRIEGTDADVQLICNDTDSANRDEQFLGGAYGAGYFDLDGCNIHIDGYASEHGYAHNGGVAGMYMLYPSGTVYEGYLTNTRVTGKISFYEDNTDRRAYCKDFIGEVMNWTYQVARNSSDFVCDERHDYSIVLLPHTCDEPVYTTEKVNSDCENYGYELYRCQTCGYEYKDNFTACGHEVKDWQLVKESSVEAYGVEEGECALCGRYVRRTTDRLSEPGTTTYETVRQSEPESTMPVQESAQTKPEEETANEAERGTESGNGIVFSIIIIIMYGIAVILFIRCIRRLQKK